MKIKKCLKFISEAIVIGAFALFLVLRRNDD